MQAALQHDPCAALDCTGCRRTSLLSTAVPARCSSGRSCCQLARGSRTAALGFHAASLPGAAVPQLWAFTLPCPALYCSFDGPRLRKYLYHLGVQVPPSWMMIDTYKWSRKLRSFSHGKGSHQLGTIYEEATGLIPEGAHRCSVDACTRSVRLPACFSYLDLQCISECCCYPILRTQLAARSCRRGRHSSALVLRCAQPP
jgi:hypothetical protein